MPQYTADNYKALYAALPGPTPAQTAKYNADLAAYNALPANSPQRIVRETPKGGQIGGPPTPPMSQQQAQFTSWMANGGGSLGYDWNGNQQNNSFFDTVVPMLVAAGTGAAFAPALVAAAGAGGLTGAAGAAATGAAQGAIGSVAGAGLTGGPLTAGGVVKGAVTGALGGAGTKGLTPYVQNATGLGNTAAAGLTGAGLGAVGGAVSGQGAAAGAAGGLLNGLASSNAGKALQTNIFGNAPAGQALAGAVKGGVNTALQGGNVLQGALTAGAGSLVNSGLNSLSGPFSNNSNNPSTGSNSNMANDYSALDPNFFSSPSTSGGGFTSDYGYGGYNPQYSNSNYGFDTTGGIDQNYLNQINQQIGTGGGQSAQGSGGLLSGLGSKAVGALGGLLNNQGSQAGGATGGALGSLLGGLLGPALGYAGSSMNNAAARDAARELANNSRFQPYGVTTSGGNASFNGTTATGGLNSQNQGLYNGLLGLGNSAIQGISDANTSVGGYRGINQPVYDANQQATQAGNNLPQQNVNNGNYNGLMSTYGNQAQQYANQASQGMPTEAGFNQQYNNRFNQLQDLNREANNRFMSGNLDSQFANGVLASTAGQYQTQGALDALNRQTTQNQLTAQDFAGQDYNRQLGGFNALNQASTGAANNYLGLGQNQYAQNANQNNLQYNRASDAFTRAMGLFTGGNQQANQNITTQQGNLGAANTGISNYNNYTQGLLGLGAGIGGTASQANFNAYAPLAGANAVSTNGNFLSGAGNALMQQAKP